MTSAQAAAVEKLSDAAVREPHPVWSLRLQLRAICVADGTVKP